MTSTPSMSLTASTIFSSVFTGDGVDGDVANDEVAADTDDVDRSDVAAGAADRGGYFTESAGASRKLDAQGQAVTGAGRSFH